MAVDFHHEEEILQLRWCLRYVVAQDVLKHHVCSTKSQTVIKHFAKNDLKSNDLNINLLLLFAQKEGVWFFEKTDAWKLLDDWFQLFHRLFELD